jgi:hypothetical protein
MDLDLDGQNLVEGDNYGVTASGLFNRLLALRLNIHDTWGGVAASHWILASGAPLYDEWSVVDSSMTGIPGCNSFNNYNCDWRIYMAANRAFISGNSLDNEDTGGSHVIRSERMTKGIISNNYIARAGIIQHAIKLHNWKWDGSSGGNAVPGTYSEQVEISDNKIIGGANAWTVAIEPQNDGSDERVRTIIFERNFLTTGTGTQIGVNSSASDATYRNNIINTGSVADHHTGILIQARGAEPTPNGAYVYNNTFYGTSTGDFVAVLVGSSSNVVIKNNLGYAPLSVSGSGNVVSMVDGVGEAGASVSNNSTDSQIKNTNPLFTSGTPLSPADFKPTVGSYTINAGVAVPVYSDFFGTAQSTTFSLGAIIP